MSGFLTRLIAVPFIIEMIVAILSTKVALYLGTSPLPLPPAPPQIGIWAVLHESPTTRRSCPRCSRSSPDRGRGLSMECWRGRGIAGNDSGNWDETPGKERSWSRTNRNLRDATRRGTLEVHRRAARAIRVPPRAHCASEAIMSGPAPLATPR
jgi:hypothetical protein